MVPTSILLPHRPASASPPQLHRGSRRR